MRGRPLAGSEVHERLFETPDGRSELGDRDAGIQDRPEPVGGVRLSGEPDDEGVAVPADVLRAAPERRGERDGCRRLPPHAQPPRTHRRRRARRGDGGAVAQEDGVVDEFLELGQDVTRHEHGAPRSGETAQQPAQIDARLRIQSGSRLVQKEHLRVVHQGPGETEALLLSAREHPGRCARKRPQTDVVEEGVGARARIRLRHPVEPPGHDERLPRRQRTPRAKRVRHPAEDAPRGRGILDGIDAVDADRAGIGTQQRREHEQQRGLAGSVRADEPGHAPRLGDERGAPHRLDLAEGTGDVTRDDAGRGHAPTLRGGRTRPHACQRKKATPRSA
ncbi:hypothetical protein QE377_000739 [Microbacterium sp. SORGH_AS 862]|nr:hypothetical protein [Microbacterium sp. SORGH_AS_0862]